MRPDDPRYLDQADVRREMTRVFDVCDGCRLCVDLCSSFPTLFEMLEQRPEGGAGWLTPAQQDAVVDRCHHCALCTRGCPYAPGRDDSDVDVARLMLRAQAMRSRHGHLDPAARRWRRVVGRFAAVARVARAVPAVTGAVAASAPGSRLRRVVGRVTGLSATRTLPALAPQRFSTWFAQRAPARPTPGGAAPTTASRPPADRSRAERSAVSIVATCVVEHSATAIGIDLVRVCEHLGLDCSIAEVGCCGAPSLHAGDLDRFTRIARRNVATLTAEIAAGREVVVAQPTCAHVIRHDYPDHLDGPDVALVAERTRDASSYVEAAVGAPDVAAEIAAGVTAVGAAATGRIALHASSHRRPDVDIAPPGGDLLRLAGSGSRPPTEVRVVAGCVGADGVWGLRASNDDTAGCAADRVAESLVAAGADLVAGDDHLSNRMTAERTGVPTGHPVSVLARALGFAPEGAPPAPGRSNPQRDERDADGAGPELPLAPQEPRP